MPEATARQLAGLAQHPLLAPLPLAVASRHSHHSATHQRPLRAHQRPPDGLGAGSSRATSRLALCPPPPSALLLTRRQVTEHPGLSSGHTTGSAVRTDCTSALEVSGAAPITACVPGRGSFTPLGGAWAPLALAPRAQRSTPLRAAVGLPVLVVTERQGTTIKDVL